MHHDMKRFVREILKSPRRRAIPIMTSPGIDLIGAKPVEVFRDGALQFRCIQALAGAVHADALVTFMDLSVEAEAFGSPVRYSEHENPTVSGSIASTPEAIDALAVPEVGAKRTAEVLRCAELCAANLDRPVLGGMIGPFSLAGRLADMTEIMILCYEEPEMVETVLEKVTAFLCDYAKAFKEAGADGIVMAEPAAGLLSPGLFRKFSAPYVTQICKAAKEAGLFLIYHNCGMVEPLLEDIASIPADGYSFGNAVHMETVLESMPSDRLVIGNIDPVGILRNGTPETVTKAVTELLESCSKYPGFLLSSGCDIPPLTPLENLQAFFDAAEAFYGKNI